MILLLLKKSIRYNQKKKNFSEAYQLFDRELFHITIFHSNMKHELVLRLVPRDAELVVKICCLRQLDCIISQWFSQLNFTINQIIYDEEKVSHYSGHARFDSLQEIEAEYMILNPEVSKKIAKHPTISVRV